MNRWNDRLRAFNADWNDLPRRLGLIVVLLACLALALLAFPYLAPFVLAALFAWLINPAVSYVTRLFGGRKLARGIASAVFVLLLTSALTLVLILVAGRVFGELRALAIALPGWITQATTDVLSWIDGLELDWPILEAGIEDAVMRMLADLASMLTSLATRVASTVARGAWRTASLLPQGILFIVLTLMGTFYMSADKERIFCFLRSLLPERYQARSSRMRASIIKAVFGQLRAALIMLGVTFFELSAGFLLMGLNYAVLFALIIALLDALPVIGAGLFLIPMCLYGIVTGNATLALGSGLIYLMTIVVRQLLEPRIIGRQLGLYPLATMMAMYAGMQALGFLGLILGPVTLLLCKVALTAEEAAEAPKPSAMPKLSRKPWRRK